jgi:hypothetical protein
MKKKILLSLFAVGLIGFISLNLSIAFEKEVQSNYLGLQYVESTASAGEDKPKAGYGLTSKQVQCDDGTTWYTRCEYDENPDGCPKTTNCGSSGSGTGTGNGNTDICQEQGHNMNCPTASFIYCCRCNYSDPLGCTQKFAVITGYPFS